MKTIKINFIGFGNKMDPNDNVFLDVLKKHYNVIVTEDADYRFFYALGMYDWDTFKKGVMNSYCFYDGIRIVVDGENFIPDFNLADYAISAYPISFLDRYYYIPCGVESFFTTKFRHFMELPTGERSFTRADLDGKEYFANFIVGHESEYKIRGNFFLELSKYKRIESLGKLYKNSDITVSWIDDSKLQFQNKCKFTLCFESTKHAGFLTEKLSDAFLSTSVPIYYGSSTAKDIFNPKAYIDCSDYPSFDDAIQDIIALDHDDERYMAMMREPIFLDPDYPQKIKEGFEKFLLGIFEQPLEQAKRRSTIFAPQYYEDFVRRAETRELRFTKYDRNLKKLKSKVSKFLKRKK